MDNELKSVFETTTYSVLDRLSIPKEVYKLSFEYYAHNPDLFDVINTLPNGLK